MNKIWVFGERHTTAERDRVEKEILTLIESGEKIDYILSEEAGDAVGKTTSELKRLIQRHYYSISARSYRLGIKLGIPVIGIDNWPYRDQPLPIAFKLVEERMLSVTKEYHKLGNCVVLVGDTHLRRTVTKELGASSSFYHGLMRLGAMVFRSPLKELD